jgi:hypothetical protein
LFFFRSTEISGGIFIQKKYFYTLMQRE